MNKREKIIKRNKTLSQIKRSSLSGTKVGYSKCWKGVSKEHYLVMSEIVWILTNNYDFEVFTEVEFINGGRADIFAIDEFGEGYIVEVLNSETDERFNAKLEYYPNFYIRKVKVSDFDGNNWEI